MPFLVDFAATGQATTAGLVWSAVGATHDRGSRRHVDADSPGRALRHRVTVPESTGRRP